MRGDLESCRINRLLEFWFDVRTLFAPPGAHSQAPIRRIFGVGDAEFFKGAWMKIRPDSAGVDTTTMNGHWQQIWRLADTRGILRIQGHDFDNFDITNAMVSQRTDWLHPRLSMLLLAIA